MQKKNIILILIITIILLISSILLIRKYYYNFQNEENYYEEIDDKISNLMNSPEWTKMSTSEKKHVAATLLKKLEREGKIKNLFYDSSNMLFSFQYKDGTLGGLSINIPWEEPGYESMPIN